MATHPWNEIRMSGGGGGSDTHYVKFENIIW
jgi:hypothetical protein